MLWVAIASQPRVFFIFQKKLEYFGKHKNIYHTGANSVPEGGTDALLSISQAGV
jgi:hypothetical protein